MLLFRTEPFVKLANAEGGGDILEVVENRKSAILLCVRLRDKHTIERRIAQWNVVKYTADG